MSGRMKEDPYVGHPIALQTADTNPEKLQSDLISWLIDAAPEKLKTMRDFVFRVVLLNFAAIHTTASVSLDRLHLFSKHWMTGTQTLADTLFDLAPRPEYIEPLRAEVEEIINEFGWTKEAMGRMRKLDSFIRESSRFGGISACASIPSFEPLWIVWGLTN
jgi:hypothetical protein